MDIVVPTAEELNKLLQTLQQRFEHHKHRHLGVAWSTIQQMLQASTEKLHTIYQMEITGGEPDVIVQEDAVLTFCDCSRESPQGRRALCYDKEAWDSRQEFKPLGNVIDTAKAMGITVLNEAQYLHMQQLEAFDLKTSSWLLTPPAIRSKKGAIFGDRRYDHTFIYHNGAESYYAARGFRGLLKL